MSDKVECPFCPEQGFYVEPECCGYPVVEYNEQYCCGLPDQRQIPCEACEGTNLITQERIDEIKKQINREDV